MTHPIQLPPSLDVLFCALQDPVPLAQLVEKARELSGSEWQRLAVLAIHHHRVGPRVWKALKELENSIVPADVAERLATEAQQATIGALVSKAETARVITALNQMKIEPCLLKGWALEEDLSGEPGQRVVRDIDVMIKYDELTAATQVLQELGYSSPSTEVLGSLDALNSFLRFAHHIVFFRPQSQTMVELHLRPFRNRHLYSWEGICIHGKTSRPKCARPKFAVRWFDTGYRHCRPTSFISPFMGIATGGNARNGCSIFRRYSSGCRRPTGSAFIAKPGILQSVGLWGSLFCYLEMFSRPVCQRRRRIWWQGRRDRTSLRHVAGSSWQPNQTIGRCDDGSIAILSTSPRLRDWW
jgi:hypothetical protein